jgi:hypothetical protein
LSPSASLMVAIPAKTSARSDTYKAHICPRVSLGTLVG